MQSSEKNHTESNKVIWRKLATSFNVENVSCTSLEEFFAHAYKCIVGYLTPIIARRCSFKLTIRFFESYLNNEHDAQQLLDASHYNEKWCYNIINIAQFYYTFAGEVAEIVSSTTWVGSPNHSYELWVWSEDLDDELD